MSIGFVILIVISTSCREDIINERNEYFEHAELSIGEINFFVYSRLGNSYIVYSYSVDDDVYNGEDGDCGIGIESSEARSIFYKVKKGERFLVFYKKEDPEKSIIRLDYPISDSADFERYLTELR